MAEANYIFRVYEEDGGKYFLEDFSLSGAIDMAAELRKNEEVFTVLKDDGTGNLEEVKEGWAAN